MCILTANPTNPSGPSSPVGPLKPLNIMIHSEKQALRNKNSQCPIKLFVTGRSRYLN